MAMKMDRRSFLKTSAAVAVAVSMTGLLGGCSDGAIGTAGTEWEGYINVWVRIKESSGIKKPQPIPAKGYFFLKIDGQLIDGYTDGGLLENGGKINLTQGQLKEGWMCFTLKNEQRALYEAVVARKAEVTFTISSASVTEVYKLDYTTETFVKQTV